MKMSKKEQLKNNIYVQLFVEFFKLGLFTIGGGMAMIPLIQDIVVNRKNWMTEEEAVDCIAVSQGLPGVIAINMATYIGHDRKGIKGAIAATTGVILPSFIIIILVVKLLSGFGDNSYVQGALIGIKAAATGLIAFAAYRVGKQTLKNAFQWILAIVTFALIIRFDISAVWFILAGVIAGIVYDSYMEKKEVKK